MENAAMQMHYSPMQVCIPEKPVLEYNKVAINRLVWWQVESDPRHFPYVQVIHAYHKVGKHFVSRKLLNTLVKVRERIARYSDPAYRQVLDFLNVVLDKYDDTYDYRSYLALSLLDLPDSMDSAEADHTQWPSLNRALIVLLTDIVQFELAAYEGHAQWLPEIVPDRDLLKRRCRMALKCFAYLNGEALPEKLEHLESVLWECNKRCMRIDATQTWKEKYRLMITMLPVYVVHDEYLFLRVLQCFETTFAWLAVHLRHALDICESSTSDACDIIERCHIQLKFATQKFFPLLSTMQPEAFRVFRKYTEGASAIQSRSYKRIESLCRIPDDFRMNSIAYDSVPEVKATLLSGVRTFDEVIRDMKHSNRALSVDFDRLLEQLRAFDMTLQMWRKSHYGIAVKMLGEATGTGYTEGKKLYNTVF